MQIGKRTLIAGAMLATTLGGGALGATLFSPGVSSAQTTTTTPSTSSGSGASGATGTFHSNEDATHEAGESAAREAQEDAGQIPTVP